MSYIISNKNHDKPKEECAIFGIFNCPEASKFTYLGLYAQQHRGQESSGIVSTDGKKLYRYAKMGLVANIFKEEKLEQLIGNAAIGHNRYSTTGASFLRNAQPLRVESYLGPISLAHNGNLVNSWHLREQLETKGSIFQTTIDSEVIVHLIAKSNKENLIDAFIFALKQIEGAYSMVCLTKDTIIAVRDPNGFRPLVMGKMKNGATIFASETCAFDIIEADYVRDLEPGEMIIVQKDKTTSLYPFDKRKSSLCVFEYIYFARPDSTIFGRSVYTMRKNFGKKLAMEKKISADVVISVPDSANVAAFGYAEQSGILYQSGIVRSHYVGRTFIEPEQKIRDFGAKIKYNVVKDVVKGKRVILVDDSIMRGTTSRKIIKMLKEAGAKEIHFFISAPPTISACYYGIDIPSEDDLIAHKMNIEEIKEYLDVNTLHYLSLESMAEVVKNSENFCDGCFTKNYPIRYKFSNKYENKKGVFEEYAIEEN